MVHKKFEPDKPSLWTTPLEQYLRAALTANDEYEFKDKIILKEHQDNMFIVYCERILIDLYVRPVVVAIIYILILFIFSLHKQLLLDRHVGERTYIVVNISPLFVYYECLFPHIQIHWIEAHQEAAKVVKSSNNSGIVKIDAIGMNKFNATN